MCRRLPAGDKIQNLLAKADRTEIGKVGLVQDALAAILNVGEKLRAVGDVRKYRGLRKKTRSALPQKPDQSDG